jgi:hypothetical protein
MSSIIQKHFRILWNPNVHHRILKSSALVPILSQINPVRAHVSPLEDLFNIMLPSTSESSKWYFSLRFSHETFVLSLDV